MDNKLINSYKGKYWIGYVKRNNGKKVTKIPTDIHGKPLSVTSGNFYKLKELKNNKSIDGVGIVLGYENNLLGVDLDNVLKDGKLTNSIIYEFINNCNTYSEISPSGNGLHIFLDVEGLELKAKKKTNEDGTVYEMYTKGRFFTFTNNVFTNNEVRKVTPQEAEELLSELGYPFGRENEGRAQDNAKTIEDQQVLNIAFSSIKGEKIKRLYEGDTTEHNNDSSSADLAFCSYISFFSGNKEQVERIWLSSKLGLREKTQKRADYRKSVIDKAMSGKNEFYKPKKEAEEKQDDRFVLNENNVLEIMQQSEFKDKIKYNLFSERKEFEGEPFTDYHYLEVLISLQNNYPELKKLSKTMVQNVVDLFAMSNKFHPIRDWLKTLKWDGGKRIDYWVDTVCGVSEGMTEQELIYREEAGKVFLKGMVARILRPGVKFDYCLVLEGKQGVGKSTLFQVLAGEKYHYEVNSIKNISDKELLQTATGKWIVDLAEGALLTRSSLEEVKATITTTSDQYRKAYGREQTYKEREYVFAMTTNRADYLRDETGGRRFLPIRVFGVENGFIDLEWLKSNREQLFAEAIAEWKSDGKLTIDKYLTEPEQAKRQLKDPISDVLFNYIDNFPESHKENTGFTMEEICQETQISLNNPKTTWKIGSLLREAGYISKTIREQGKVNRKWILLKDEDNEKN